VASKQTLPPATVYLRVIGLGELPTACLQPLVFETLDGVGRRSTASSTSCLRAIRREAAAAIAAICLLACPRPADGRADYVEDAADEYEDAFFYYYSCVIVTSRPAGCCSPWAAPSGIDRAVYPDDVLAVP
jgi:hypothetical protein